MVYIMFGDVESTFDSFDSSTVYTDHNYDAGNGWTELLTDFVYNCTFKEENGEIYVDSFLYVSTKQYSEEISPGVTQNYTIQGSLSTDFVYFPQRKGYTFRGWALNRNGEIVVGIQESVINAGIYYALNRTQLEQIPDNTVLYAVWEKNE